MFLLLLVSVVAISHRGEHLHHPENTMPAFRAAVDAGADFIEVDVRTTSDGKIVLMHDATVDRTTNGHGEVAEMTLEEIRKLDAGIKFSPEFAGTKVPTFDEVLEFARGKIGVYIDAKRISAVDLVAAVGKFGLDDHVVVYGGVDLHREIQKLNPRIRVMPEAVSVEIVTKLVKELSPRVMAFDARDFKDEIIAVAKQANAGIYVDRLGLADNPASWEDAVNRGATGIQSDHPAELVRFLRDKGWHSSTSPSTELAKPEKYNGAWWLATDPDTRSGWLNGAADCLTWVAQLQGFNGTPEELDEKITGYYRSHPADLRMAVRDVWQKLVSNARTAKPTPGGETWKNKHWYLNGWWWQGESDDQRLGFAEGYLWCLRTQGNPPVDTYPRSPKFHVQKIDAYLKTHPKAEDEAVADILARFQDKPVRKGPAAAK